MNNLRDEFLLDPNIIFLNHGSFGATPKPVFETYLNWQRELEHQPVKFLGRAFDDLMNEARATLGQYINVPADALIFVPNATIGLNTIARSLDLQVGDEILSTNLEYGAMDKMWQFVAQKTGASYIRHPIEFPASDKEALVESFLSGITSKTRVLFMSHITSETAVIMPVAEICRRARELGILTIIDGAHAPGQIPLDIQKLAPDVYAGNCHKWLCSPKGAGFLYVHSDLHEIVDPLIISWGWGEGSNFVTTNQWQGTRDIAAFLSVTAAIEFQEKYHWDVVRNRCHELASETRARIGEITGLPPLTHDSDEWFRQMFSVVLPPVDEEWLKQTLYDNHHIEVPITRYGEQQLLRVSLQGYNTQADADALIMALEELIPMVV